MADPVAQVHGALAVRAGPWLLLLDNAPDADTVHRLVPPRGHGHVVATSRSAAFRPAEGLPVPVLQPAAAAALLVEQTGSDGLSPRPPRSPTSWEVCRSRSPRRART
jgi:hypothetical protein